jgi:cytochrome d ubiquinol oxidase subunit II
LGGCAKHNCRTEYSCQAARIFVPKDEDAEVWDRPDIKKTDGPLERWARGIALLSAIFTASSALLLTIGTWLYSAVGQERWTHAPVMHLLFGLGALAALAFAGIIGTLLTGGSSGPFRASVLLFLVSFAGLAISLFPYFIPGRLKVVDAASDPATLVFMLIGIGLIFPVMIGYNLYQYHLFRGKVVAGDAEGE